MSKFAMQLASASLLTSDSFRSLRLPADDLGHVHHDLTKEWGWYKIRFLFFWMPRNDDRSDGKVCKSSFELTEWPRRVTVRGGSSAISVLSLRPGGRMASAIDSNDSSRVSVRPSVLLVFSFCCGCGSRCCCCRASKNCAL